MSVGDTEWLICRLRTQVVSLCELLTYLEQSGPLRPGDDEACRNRIRQVVKNLNQLERNFTAVVSNES